MLVLLCSAGRIRTYDHLLNPVLEQSSTGQAGSRGIYPAPTLHSGSRIRTCNQLLNRELHYRCAIPEGNFGAGPLSRNVFIIAKILKIKRPLMRSGLWEYLIPSSSSPLSLRESMNLLESKGIPRNSDTY